MLKSEKVHNQTLGLGIPRWKACVGVFTGLCKKVRTLEEFAFFETRFLIIYIRGNFFLDASSFHDGIIYHLKIEGWKIKHPFQVVSFQRTCNVRGWGGGYLIQPIDDN